MKKNEKITVIITTFNSETSFKKLWETLPLKKIDNVIVINGGNEYKSSYKTNNDQIIWIQHTDRHNIAYARNEGLRIAQQIGNTHIFLMEDD